MCAGFPGLPLPLPLHREPARGGALHNVEAIRGHTVTYRSLPGSLPRPKPWSLSDQRQPAGIVPDVKMILGGEGLVSLGIVGRKFERHDTESTAPFTFDNATPLLASLRASAHPQPSPTPRNASCGLLGLSESVWVCARAPEWGELRT